MERNTKIFIGVGAAALIAFLLLRKKAAATTTGTASGGTASGGTSGGGTASGGGSTSPKTCPEGQELMQVECVKAPCEPICMPKNLGGLFPKDPLPPQDPCMTARLSCTEGFVAKNVDGVCRCVVDDTVLVLDPPALGDYSGRMKEIPYVPETPYDASVNRSGLVNLYL